MLYESDVSSAVVKHLKKNGYKIVQELKPTQKGIDIIAEKGNEVLCIEAKGETSFRKGSNRYGKAFHSGQVTHHVARALYSTIRDFELKEFGRNTKVAMAFPDTPEFRKRVGCVYKSIKRLKIPVYLVASNRKVSLASASSFQ